MRLIDVETGIEYQSTLCEVRNRVGNFTYDLVVTGKTYLVQPGYANFELALDGELDFTKRDQGQDHTAICFLSLKANEND